MRDPEFIGTLPLTPMEKQDAREARAIAKEMQSLEDQLAAKVAYINHLESLLAEAPTALVRDRPEWEEWRRAVYAALHPDPASVPGTGGAELSDPLARR